MPGFARVETAKYPYRTRGVRFARSAIVADKAQVWQHIRRVCLLPPSNYRLDPENASLSIIHDAKFCDDGKGEDIEFAG